MWLISFFVAQASAIALKGFEIVAILTFGTGKGMYSFCIDFLKEEI